jgi:hypothetical protein
LAANAQKGNASAIDSRPIVANRSLRLVIHRLPICWSGNVSQFSG